MKLVLALALMASTAGLKAGTLADVKRMLTALHATSPIAVSYETRHTNAAKGRFYNANFDNHGTADVQVSDNGLTMSLPRTAVLQMRTRRLASTGSDNNTSNELTGEVSAARVAELTDYGPTLQALLARAVVVSERDTILGTTPARLLTLKVGPERSKVSEIKVDSKGDTLSLWIARDGLPIAAERRSQFSVGFLFLKATGVAREKWTFIHHDDRLVATRMERYTYGSGMGQSSNGTELETIQVH
jgi:hypothetical protein